MATTTRILDANVSGTVYTINANDALAALDTCHSGATAPIDEVANGKFWLDTSTTPSVLKVYDNAGWNIVYSGRGDLTVAGTVNATALAGDGTGITGVATAAQGALADTAVQPADNISTLTNDAGYLTVAPSPFEPTTVTGTTPSLDVGTYNYFEQGVLTGDTTVTFASVPTEARWAYSFKPGGIDTWDISTTSFLQSLSIAAQDIAPRGLFFKPDGTKMYIAGAGGQDINEYNLSFPWNISTASFLQVFSVSAQDTSPEGLFFKPDGTKMYVVGLTGVDVNEYNLSTPWDVSTAAFLQLKSVSAQDTAPRGVFFKPDGTKMYVVGGVGQDINEYNLSTAWDVSTAVFLQLKSVSAQDTSAWGLFFKPDGTKMYVTGSTGDDVNEYNLSTAWNISTASFLQLKSIAAQDIIPKGLFFNPDGAKMYFAGDAGDSVYEYDIGGALAITLPASVQRPPAEYAKFGTTVTYEFATLDGGTTVRLINEEVL